MAYSLVDLAKSLKVGSCRIQNTPNFIFLCGGKITRDTTRVASATYLSARDFFYRHLLDAHPLIAERVKLAEEVNAWFRQSPFVDLLELESYLAAISDTILLFVESPGSIAELGAFAAIDVLGPKTLAIINSVDDDEASFISDGPIKRLKNHNRDLVHYYNWDASNVETLNSTASLDELAAMARYLVDSLEKRTASRAREPSLEIRERGHALLLVADLLRLVGTATITDIAAFLGEIGWTGQRAELNRHLSLLQSIGFIAHRPYGDQQFYLGQTTTSFIRYAYKPDARLKDPNRVQSELRNSLDVVRTRILQAFLRKGRRDG